MGKKPLIGAVGLWVGLSLTGCSDCGCFHRSNGNKYHDGGTILSKGQEPKSWNTTPGSVASGGASVAPSGTGVSGVPASGSGGLTPAGGAGMGVGSGVEPIGTKVPPPAAPGGPSVSDAGPALPGRDGGSTVFNVPGAPAVKAASGLTDPPAPGSAVKQTSQLYPVTDDAQEPTMKMGQKSSLSPVRAGAWADHPVAGGDDAGRGPTPLPPPPLMSKTMRDSSTPLTGDAPAVPVPAPLPPAGPDAAAQPPVPAAGAGADLKSSMPPPVAPLPGLSPVPSATK